MLKAAAVFALVAGSIIFWELLLHGVLLGGMNSRIVYVVLFSLFFAMAVTVLTGLLPRVGNVILLWVCMAVLYLLYVYRSALQGMGNMVIPMLSGGVEFVMRVGIAFWAGTKNWSDGLFMAEIFAWTGAALLLAISYYISAAKLKKLAVS